MADTPPTPFVEPTSPRRELIGFLAETAAVLVTGATALLAALPLSLIGATVLTAAITGWREPGPDIVQGCETSLMCSEGGTFMVTWAGSVLAYVVVAVLGLRFLVGWLGLRRRRRCR
jgi:hypothetical protein